LIRQWENSEFTTRDFLIPVLVLANMDTLAAELYWRFEATKLPLLLKMVK